MNHPNFVWTRRGFISVILLGPVGGKCYASMNQPSAAELTELTTRTIDQSIARAKEECAGRLCVVKGCLNHINLTKVSKQGWVCPTHAPLYPDPSTRRRR